MTGANSQALLPVWIFIFFNKLNLRCSDIFRTNQGAKAARSLCWFLLSALLLFSADLHAQTPGLIYKPATGAGKAVLDPNGDGYTSATSAGYHSAFDYANIVAHSPVVVDTRNATRNVTTNREKIRLL